MCVPKEQFTSSAETHNTHNRFVRKRKEVRDQSISDDEIVHRQQAHYLAALNLPFVAAKHLNLLQRAQVKQLCQLITRCREQPVAVHVPAHFVDGHLVGMERVQLFAHAWIPKLDLGVLPTRRNNTLTGMPVHCLKTIHRQSKSFDSQLKEALIDNR